MKVPAVPIPAASTGAVPASLRILLILKTSEGGLWVIPHIEELRSRGHEVVVILPPTPGRLRTALGERGVSLVDSAFDFTFRPSLATLVGLGRLRRQVREIVPDVLHYHLYASALAARFASLGMGLPTVHMVAGPLYLESRTIRLFERYLSRLDTVTIAGSDFTSSAYQKLGRNVSDTPVVPYGVDTDHFRPLGSRAQVRADLGIATDAFVAIMAAYAYAPKRRVLAGRGVKGHDVLLEAWSRFHAEHIDSHLLLVGGGFDERGERYRRGLVDQFQTSDDRSGVSWVDTTDDVRPYYSAADVSVSPSLSDNHGAALQAGAMGVPSIVSDAGALPETVDDGCGWVVFRDDPAALLGALVEAHAEHVAGQLALRGPRARTLVLERFQDGTSAGEVADLIERAACPDSGDAQPPRVLTIFTEARFGRGVDGRWGAHEAANGPAAWEAYMQSGDGVHLVARADPCPGSGTVPLPEKIQMVPLPHYVGARNLAKLIVPIAFSVGRAVTDAQTIVLRVPGVIGTLAAVSCRLSGRKYAVDVVGDPADVLAAGVLGRTGRWLAPVAEAQMRWIVHGAAASRFVTRGALQKRYPPRPGTTSAGISDVRLGPGSVVSVPRCWAPGPFQVVMVGSQETRHKGHDVLLRAMRILLDEGMDLRAILVGGGRMEEKFAALAQSLGIGDRVTFAGTITSRERIVEILDAASLFALPSRGEGMPRALIEAMARALPAVATDVGGISELLDSSCLVPADDFSGLAGAMRSLLSDPVLWEEQSRRNLDIARIFDAAVLDQRFSAWLGSVPPARRHSLSRTSS